MLLTFYKYQGTGNDFVIIDNRQDLFPRDNVALVAQICDRKFGVGSDGLILLENDDRADFKMVYYNADGNEGSMCGNGGRCIVALAKQLNVIENGAKFNAVDGQHHATITHNLVYLEMQNVKEIRTKPGAIFLNTGSPHHVQIVTDLEHFKVVEHGRKLRYGLYGQQGSNINFVEQIDQETFSVRTYERGVEDETLSCGTGVTAVALAMHSSGKTIADQVKIVTLGGNLEVKFMKIGQGYENIQLIGPAQFVYKGEIEC